MKLVIIFGPQAVGKMTVGQELEKITELKLFHNHMTIDLVSCFFDYGSPQGKRLVSLFRREIFEEVAKSDLPGLIFTYVWALDLQGDWDYIEKVSEIFESRGGTVCLVELESSLDTRLDRNKSANRLQHKPTKRDVNRSERDLLETMQQYRLNSLEGEIRHEHYLRIMNDDVNPEEAARIIKDRFNL